MWNTVGSRRGWSAMALLLTLSGCTALSDTKYELGQRIRAKHAWEEFNSCQCEPLTCDYACGWKAGYYDVATGGTGCPPVVAPKRYWKPPVFCEHDPSKRDDWYCGFSAGAACAQSQPDYHYVKACLPRVCCPVQDYSIPPASMEQPSEPSQVPPIPNMDTTGTTSHRKPSYRAMRLRQVSTSHKTLVQTLVHNSEPTSAD
jgi:hypothetical protein